MMRARIAWAWLFVSLVASGSRATEPLATSRSLPARSVPAVPLATRAVPVATRAEAAAEGVVFASGNEFLYWGGTLGTAAPIAWENYPHSCLWSGYCNSLPPSHCESLARIAQCGPHWSTGRGCSCLGPCLRACRQRSWYGHRHGCGQACEAKRLCGCSRPALGLFADLLLGPRHCTVCTKATGSDCTDPGAQSAPQLESAPQPPAVPVVDPAPVPPANDETEVEAPEAEASEAVVPQANAQGGTTGTEEAKEPEDSHETGVPQNTIPN